MAEEELIHLTIDGRPVTVPKGTLIWAAARQLGIEVPIYCYHPKMPPLGACRMCFVEVEKMPKLQTACTTVCTEGMIVRTDTPAVKKARRGTLEFLLINHPLDCPICDKGGECDLQDFTLRHGPGTSRFDVTKRHFIKPISVSEHVLLDRERCILCQRCVRFCQDVTMENGLIMIKRGYRMEVGVEPEHPWDSIFSGNTVEMCPVGALTAKSFRFRTRPWELRKTPSICANCSVGCNARVDVRIDKVLRLMSRTNDHVDDGWLCDRGRWGCEYVNSPERLRTPLVRRNGALVPTTWDDALATVAQKLREVAQRHGPHAVGGIGSTHVTNEEAYLFQKLLRTGLATNNIDHYHGNFTARSPEGLPWVWSDSIAGLEQASHIVLFAADPYHRQPVLDLRIKKAYREGTPILLVNEGDLRLDRFAALKVRYRPGTLQQVVRALLNVVISEGLYVGASSTRANRGAGAPGLEGNKDDLGPQGPGHHRGQEPAPTEVDEARLHRVRRTVHAITPEHVAQPTGVPAEALCQLAREIAGAPGAVLLYDEMATRTAGGETLAQDLFDLALLTGNFGRPGAGVGPLFEDNNSLGARDMGVLPDSLPGYRTLDDAEARSRLGAVWGVRPPDWTGKDYAAMLRGGVKALYVMGANPARHLPELGDRATLDGLEFLVVQDMFLTETAQRADVVLPALSFVEKEGSFTNTDRHVQAVRRALPPLPGARSDWDILQELAQRWRLEWNYRTPRQVLLEIARVTPIYSGLRFDLLETRPSKLTSLVPVESDDPVMGKPGVQWPATPENVRSGGSAYLTSDMLETGLPAYAPDPSELALSAPASGDGFVGSGKGERV
jgi:NADH-quinone oxidoreductase subunit G